MARPTRSRRTSKHRGNAAGMIESRGRTGRKPTASEKRSTASRSSQTSRRARHDKQPTWKGAAIRAVIAAAIVYALLTVVVKHTDALRNLLLLPVVVAVYMPLIYYTDRYMYRRAQRKRDAR